MTRAGRRPLVVALAMVAAATAGAVDRDLARYVDPFIGTGGHGHTFPGATLPFAMVQLSPDTRLHGWDGCSGYHFSDTVVYGFSHTHLSGTGVSDYGDILLMPVTGTPRLANGSGQDPDDGYASRFDKASERAAPGWYAVRLADYDIDVELTATLRVGMHRYRYPAGQPAHVVVDLTHRDRVLDSAFRVVSDREVEGFRRSDAWARDQVVYFVARFSRPFTNVSLAADDVVQSAAKELEGSSVKAVLSFGDGGGELLVKVGVSAVDVDGARRNLAAELPGWDFDRTRNAARRTWNQALAAIEVESGSEEQWTVFYTALYHSLVAPNTFSDVDGRYRGMDRSIHHAEDRRHYTVFSLWDTFRATHPLLTIIEPRRTGEFINTFLAQFGEGGRLPVWELAGNETDCMIGYHSASVIADAYIKGIRGFDATQALAAMVHSATRDHFGLDAYRTQGFIAADDESESVSKTLEYAYDDWCIARMADALGREDVAREFYGRSQAWRHLLDPHTRFMRARLNQRWIEPFDPRRVDFNYTEANAWQYTFFVPHDIGGLIEALGGEREFVTRLDALFAADSRTTGRDQADITGLIGQYAHGNEPSHHVAWLYHYAGRPDRSQRRVRQILDTLYAATPDGLSGNEDCGQMSSWYVLSAIGLYPVCPGRAEYVLGCPVFSRVTLHLDGGRDLVIRTSGQGRKLYIRSASLNNQPLSRSFIRHHEITDGGTLDLMAGPSPDPGWGRAPSDRPRSAVPGQPVVPAPFVEASGDSFRDSMRVNLKSSEPEARIRYAVEPHLSVGEGAWWPGPTVLRHSSEIRFRAEIGAQTSPTVRSSFYRIPWPWTIEVVSTPNPQYTGGGSDVLIDGRRGPDDWRLGAWQGFQHTDLEAVVDLKEVRAVRRAGASFIQDARSWIWMPTEVEVWVSEDGVVFHQVARVENDLADDTEEVVRRDLVADLGGVETRFIRVVARNYGTIPDWHPGRGGGAFIFVDEILVE